MDFEVIHQKNKGEGNACRVGTDATESDYVMFFSPDGNAEPTYIPKLIKKMNLQFRKINKSTDVLTFVSKVNINMKKPRKICDIFLSAETILKDSKINEINFYDHLTHIIVHSFLHINGFVHKKINDFVQMKNEEIKVLKKLSISNPYLL